MEGAKVHVAALKTSLEPEDGRTSRDAAAVDTRLGKLRSQCRPFAQFSAPRIDLLQLAVQRDERTSERRTEHAQSGVVCRVHLKPQHCIGPLVLVDSAGRLFADNQDDKALSVCVSRRSQRFVFDDIPAK